MMKLNVTYTDGVKTLGTDCFDIRTNFEDDMQKRGRELGAKFARTDDRMSSYNIRYGDKHSVGLTARGLECDRK